MASSTRQMPKFSQSSDTTSGIQLPASHTSKLESVPKGAVIQKRPMSRPQQPASSKSSIIYVSSTTPHMAVVKRVRKQLDRGLVRGPSTAKMSLSQRITALERDNTNPAAGKDVTVLGTGKAVQRCLSVASWFTQQNDCIVAVRTRTVGTVDDVIFEDNAFENASRVRRISALEVTIRLK